MREGPVRLSELKREIPLASTARLRSLEAARIVLRRELSSSVLHVEYTDLQMQCENPSSK
jgi:DNA-binding HxlR family transcriptional regulator